MVPTVKIQVPLSRLLFNLLGAVLFIGMAYLMYTLIGPESRRYLVRVPAALMSVITGFYIAFHVLWKSRRPLVVLTPTHLRAIYKGLDIPWTAIRSASAQQGLFNPYRHWLTLGLDPAAAQALALPETITLKLAYASGRDFDTVLRWIHDYAPTPIRQN